MEDGKFIETGSLNKPPAVLMTGVSKLRALHLRKGSAIRMHVNSMLESNPAMQQEVSYRNPEDDQLFQGEYDHIDSDKDCKSCDEERLIQRKPRTTNVPVIHYGVIGSANEAMRHGATRERLRQEKGIICFETEAAGLMDNFPCLVIRGICDYSDTHTPENWQPYAGATAAAYAKELLEVIPPVQVDKMPSAADVIKASLLHFSAYP
jgi:nucleoside phosphorylase